MNIYVLRPNEKYGTGSVDISLCLMRRLSEIEPGTEIRWRNRIFNLAPGGTPTDLIFVPEIECVFSPALKECLEPFLLNEPVKWYKLRINYENKVYPYYFLSFYEKLKGLVCKEQSTIYNGFYFYTYFYPSKIALHDVFYNPARNHYQYIVTDKVVSEIKKRKFTGICIDKNCVFLAKE